MNTVDLIALGAASLVLVIYGLYFLYFSGYTEKENKISLMNKLKKSSLGIITQPEEDHVTLLKAAPETYFRSKLPKVEGLKEWIQHSGLDIKPAILVIVSIAIGLLLIFVFVFILHVNFLLAILFGVISSFILPWIFISVLTSRRKKLFLEEFPIALDTIRRALRAGHSMDRAIRMVVEQLQGPVGITFKEMTDQLNLGKSFEEVLAEMSNRLGIDDFRILAIVIVLQRETGGSLAESIDNFSKIIRSRQQLRKKISALTGEVRMTSMILTGIPFFIFGAVYISTPNYFNPLFYTQRGQIILMVGIAMLITGVGIITRMSYKEMY